MLRNKLQMHDDKTETILVAQKGLATEHLPKSIKIDDTAINFCAYVTRPRGYIGLFTFIQSACNEHM